jgi:hypothetical protein
MIHAGAVQRVEQWAQRCVRLIDGIVEPLIEGTP